MQAPEGTVRRAKSLRRRMTLPEVLLWQRLRADQVDGCRIRRQHPVGGYVLDFYCDAARLAIEVDGVRHHEGGRPERDERRDGWLSEKGIRTLRLPASLVLRDIDCALRMIRHALRDAGLRVEV